RFAHHAYLFHRAHEAPAEIVHAFGHVRARSRLARADPREVVVPHEREHAHAVLEEEVQVVEALLDRMSPLDAGDARDDTCSLRTLAQRCVPGPFQCAWM